MTTETGSLPAALGPDEFPVPFGIEAETGAALPGLTEADLGRIVPDSKDVQDRGRRSAGDRLAIRDVNPNNLAEAGWCVVFPEAGDPAIKKALEPLLAHREGEAKRTWLERHGAGFSVVDPEQGVPLYVLLVGSPREIPFEFQYLLDLYWHVGRLHFDSASEYRTYAESVVAYETANTLPHRKHAAIFAVSNAGDRPTGLLHNQVAEPIVRGTSSVRTLAGVNGFQLTPLLAENATKKRLTDLLAGQEAGGPPARRSRNSSCRTPCSPTATSRATTRATTSSSATRPCGCGRRR